MLKLKRVQLLGFKSFCDRTEVTLPGRGIAAVVGPNGCGKSNILDAVSWVLGEQSARSLRGVKMEDVIFAGTKERKPVGMAEVSLTLIDTEAYISGPLLEAPTPAGGEEYVEDWDEEAARAERAAETEDSIAEVQPGVASPQQDSSAEASGAPAGDSTDGPNSGQGGAPVVLKIRRRRFPRKQALAGEIEITRRLFRTGESEYLLNGKLCRLRDIQDIFMGTGLGPESYAIIEQERIGQILSSKPHDRRAMIEEAAGVTRFKTKKRLAELRLESAKQNLARVNDIFEEVARQMGSLKRQAAKAERYGALRDEMRSRLKLVLASRIAQMDAAGRDLKAGMEELAASIDLSSHEIAKLEEEHAESATRGYQLEAAAREASARAAAASVEMERATARQEANRERIEELDARSAAGAAEMDQARAQSGGLAAERESQRSFLDDAAREAAEASAKTTERQARAREAVAAVAGLEQELETTRRETMNLYARLSTARTETQKAENALASLEQEAERLAADIFEARKDLDALGIERGQISLQFDNAAGRLAGLERDIADLRSQAEARRTEEAEAKRRGDSLRAETAVLSGRRSSLTALIREHSYSTDTVRNLLKPGALGVEGMAPVGTLADFLEVDGQYETVVDSFLRDELNYIVVKSWDAAQEGMRLLRTDVEGRATFLVHPDDAQAKFSFAGGSPDERQKKEGVVPLKDCVRVLDGFGRSLEVILPKLGDGFVVPDAALAKSLALENPSSFFLAPSGEYFHNVTVTGGKPSAEGPLALKRELRETEHKLNETQTEAARVEMEIAGLAADIASLAARIEAAGEERRTAERESANQGAQLRQMEAEAARLSRRIEERTAESERNRERRDACQSTMEVSRSDASRLETAHAEAEARLAAATVRIGSLREERECRQQDAAAAAAQLAGLEERRLGAEAAFSRIDRMVGDIERRVAQIERQIAAAAGEKEHRSAENNQLATEAARITEVREAAAQQAASQTEEGAALRARLAESEQRLKEMRTANAVLVEERNIRSTQSAKLSADLEYAEASCVNELGLQAEEVRADDSLEYLTGEPLSAEEENCRGMKQKLESMGPVNMMALDEYKETAERHGFLETQRRDLIDSIENTQSSIREIDQITQAKFSEAFEKINANFSRTFSSLFGGGQAFMRLTDESNIAESGIDIVASPPGKKLQNVLLLSGGEKALTALSLLVAIFEHQPSPFCVLDEVDAPLDETNVGRLAEMLKAMSAETQFVLVTHSKRMMNAADLIYGVTMQEPGVSKLVSVRMGGQEHTLGKASGF